MNIIKNISLAPYKGNGENGWETSVGQAFKTVFYTSNYFAAFSQDNGDNFTPVNLLSLLKQIEHEAGYDQRAHYFPAANMMVWVILTANDDILMCLSTPEDLINSKGKSWTVYILDASVFSLPKDPIFDYPQISYGDNFLYLTFCKFKLIGSITCRFHVGELRERSVLNFQYFTTTNLFLCPCDLSGNSGLFVTQNGFSDLRVFDWKENSNNIIQYDVNIETIPTEDWKTLLPDGTNWEIYSSISQKIQGTARSDNYLWVAWTGARRVSNKTENSFPYPHIGIVRIDIQKKKLVEQRYLWNEEYAYAYPSLASNPNGEVAITFMWGGGAYFVQHGVGFVSGQTELQATTNDKAINGGRHYITVRMAFPDINRFVAAGFNTLKSDNLVKRDDHRPRYVLFER